MSSYVRFEEQPGRTGRTTRIVVVVSARYGSTLGTIGYYPRWREYVLESQPGVVWSDGCLGDVQAKVAALNAERRARVADRGATTQQERSEG